MNLIDEYILTDLMGYLNFLVTRANDEANNEKSNDEILALYDNAKAREAYQEKMASSPSYQDWEYNKMMDCLERDPVGMRDDY